MGAGLGLGNVLLKRGDDIDLPEGTHLEIVLRTEIKLSAEQANFNRTYIAPARTIVPAPPAVQEHGRRKRRRNDTDLLWPLLGGLLLR